MIKKQYKIIKTIPNNYFCLHFYATPVAVYVPVKEQTSSDLNSRHQMTLKFRLTARDEDNTDPEPHWKLRVTQLECPTMSTNWWKIKDIARQIWDKKIEGDNDDGVEEEKDASGSKHTKYTLGMML